MVAHEYAHGYAALRNGDATAYQLGRLTWNPAKHIDPFMTIILPLLLFIAHAPIFGGAKPVPVNPRNYRNFKKGDIIVSLAGVTTNLIIALLCVPALMLVYAIGSRSGPFSPIGGVDLSADAPVRNPAQRRARRLQSDSAAAARRLARHEVPAAPGMEPAYQSLGRYGLIMLFLLISFGRPLLMLWFTPPSH